MTTRRLNPLFLVVLTLAALAVACSGASGPLGSVPAVSGSPEPSVAQGSPDVTPAPSADESSTPTDEPSEEPTAPDASPSPSSKPSGTTIVRTYFWLGGGQGSAGLVATLREVPGTKAVATAAVNALLAGPTALESRNAISTAVPDGTQLLGLTIEGGVATVNLSSEFASGGDANAAQTRIGQVVYTLTQFPSVKSVVVQVEGVDRGEGPRAGRLRLAPARTSGSIGRRGTPRSATRPMSPARRTSSRRRSASRSSTRPGRSSPTSRRWRRAAAAAAGRSTSRSPYSVSQWPVRDAPRLRPVREGRLAAVDPRLPGLAHAEGLTRSSQR